MDIKYNTDTKIEDNARMYKLQKANFDKEINTVVIIPNYISLKLFSSVYIVSNAINNLESRSSVGI